MSSSPRSEPIPPPITLLVLFLALLWGGNIVAIKVVLVELPPLAAAALRFALSLALIAAWAAVRRVPLKPARGEVFPLLLIGLLFTSQIACLNWGTRITHAGRATVLLNTSPLWVALLAHFLIPGDRLSRNKALGMLLSFSGLVFVFRDSIAGLRGVTLGGDLLALASGFQLGLTFIAIKRLVQRIHPLRLLVAQMVVGVGLFSILSLLLEAPVDLRLSTLGWAVLLYQGLVVGGFCFISWTLVLRRYPPSRLSLLFFTTPLWGLLLSHLLLAEPLTLNLLIGGVAVALGIFIANCRGRIAEPVK